MASVDCSERRSPFLFNTCFLPSLSWLSSLQPSFMCLVVSSCITVGESEVALAPLSINNNPKVEHGVRPGVALATCLCIWPFSSWIGIVVPFYLNPSSTLLFIPYGWFISDLVSLFALLSSCASFFFLCYLCKSSGFSVFFNMKASWKINLNLNDKDLQEII